MNENLYCYQTYTGKIIAGKTVRAIARYILSNSARSGKNTISTILQNVGNISYDQAMKCAIRGTLIIVE